MSLHLVNPVPPFATAVKTILFVAIEWGGRAEESTNWRYPPAETTTIPPNFLCFFPLSPIMTRKKKIGEMLNYLTIPRYTQQQAEQKKTLLSDICIQRFP